MTDIEIEMQLAIVAAAKADVSTAELLAQFDECTLFLADLHEDEDRADYLAERAGLGLALITRGVGFDELAFRMVL